MKPSLLGKKYDKIASWWHDQHHASSYGVSQFEKAIDYAAKGGLALDVGCGAGGRLTRIMENNGFAITGLDVSQEMIALAKKNHPRHRFLHQDINTWDCDEKFDLIVAWDSLFHLPYELQTPVISKLCKSLAENGVLIYSFGDDDGEHIDRWHDDEFYYSSIGINANLQLLMNSGLTILHLELDQYPQNHVYVIAALRATKG